MLLSPPDSVSPSCLVWPGTHCAAQTDLDLRTNLTAAIQPSVRVPGVSHSTGVLVSHFSRTSPPWVVHVDH